MTLLGRSRGQDVNRNGRNVFKWLRGVSVGEKAYGIPMHGDAVLKATPRVDVSKVELLGRKELRRTSGDFKWHGGQLAPNGKIYGVPCYADAVLKIDPARGDAVGTMEQVRARAKTRLERLTTERRCVVARRHR